jgi:hypothetical protein
MATVGATTSAPLQSAPDAAARPEKTPARLTGPGSRRNATDDEILGITYGHRRDAGAVVQPDGDPRSQDGDEQLDTGGQEPAKQAAEAKLAEMAPEELSGILEANPKLKAAWDDAEAYRKVFATPQEAQQATALLADLNRMDALFFSRRPEDHTQLAHAIAELDPAAFASLARAINAHLENGAARGPARSVPTGTVRRTDSGEGTGAPVEEDARQERYSRELSTQSADENAPRNAVTGLTPQQDEFFHATNASAVEGVLEAIESQVERLLPEGVNKSARSRVVAEIYRELDGTLRSNCQLAQQLREAFRSGSLDADHQRAVVSLITGRARQALPGVAKRVLQEWTSTIVAANQDRRARQRRAERRVDIAGSGGTGSDGRRSIGPRNIDYARMSDSDILNL